MYGNGASSQVKKIMDRSFKSPIPVPSKNKAQSIKQEIVRVFQSANPKTTKLAVAG
jgi:hypothetical protein